MLKPKICFYYGKDYLDWFQQPLVDAKFSKLFFVNAVNMEESLRGIPVSDEDEAIFRGYVDYTLSKIAELNSSIFKIQQELAIYKEIIKLSDVVLIDSSFLNTAMGQHLLEIATNLDKLIYGIGVSSDHSPIAHLYVSGILYPTTKEDLNFLCPTPTV